MRLFFLLLTLICLLGCEGKRDILVSDPSGSDIWIGKMTATYPGADDRPISVEDSVRFIFRDQTFTYYWLNDDDSAAGRGAYTIERNIDFSNEIEPTNYPYLTIDGIFSIQWGRTESGPDTLILLQNIHYDSNSFFETQYLITLVKGYETTD